MASLYLNLWSCSKCHYQSENVRAPVSYVPDWDTLPFHSKLENRYCFNCESIQMCFIGEGREYSIRDINHTPTGQKVEVWSFEDNSSINQIIERLKRGKANGTLEFPDKEVELLASLVKARAICRRLTTLSKKYYSQLNARPRCLNCDSHEVSKIDWQNDTHRCGGNFILEDSGRRGNVNGMTIHLYDAVELTRKYETRFV